MPDLYRQRVSAASPMWIYGVVLEGETPNDLENIGRDRRKLSRWEHATMRQLNEDIGAQHVEFIAFSARAIPFVLCGNRGISNIPLVRAQAHTQRKAMSPVVQSVRTAYYTRAIATSGMALQDRSGTHTFRPRGFPTR